MISHGVSPAFQMEFLTGVKRDQKWTERKKVK